MKRSAEHAYEQHLDSVLRFPKSRQVQPWEVSPILYPFRIFPQLPRHQYRTGHPAPATVPEGLPSVHTGAESLSHVGPKAKDSGKPWRAKMSENRTAGLVKWERIIESHSPHFNLISEAKSDPHLAPYSLNEILSDVFAVKASSTLHSRAGPVLRFLKFCKERKLEPFPVKEGLLYHFMKEYCSQQAPTFASSFLGSMAFCHHLLGLQCEGNVFTARVTGAARGFFLEKRKLVQKPPLSVLMVEALEDIVHGRGDFSMADRYAAGCFLFAVFARARFSDMQNSGLMVRDVAETSDGPRGYLEAKVTRTKTAYTLERKTRHLAMCAPINGLTSSSWALKWWDIALEHGPKSGEDQPLLPSPVENGGWQEAPISVEAGGRWLRSLLYRAGVDASAVRALGTHSLKATLLSWSAKWGMPKELRLILGYHSASRADSDVVYGRDNVAPALRALDPMIDAIVAGRFKPDCLRESLGKAPVYRHNITRRDAVFESAAVRARCVWDCMLAGEAMAASYSDSRSVFDARVDACGLPAEDAAKVKASVGSLRQLAFISSFTPGQANEAPLMESLKTMLNRDAELAVQASFRALYHEAYAVVTQEMRQKIEKSEEPTSRRLTQPERAERYDRQCKKLSGITIKGASEPSEALVDRAVSSYEINELRYIPWDVCTSREQEVASERKRDTRFTLDENTGKLKVETKDAEDKACTTSE
ncbi:unnamed protein product, partial [Symbiodinium necroappetens]